MAETEEEREKKIGLIEGFFMFAIVIIADIIDIVLKFVLLSDFGVIDIPVTFIIQLWLTMKGARWAWALAGNLVEFIPYIDTLPIRTATLIVAVYLTNHPGEGRAAKFLTGSFK